MVDGEWTMMSLDFWLSLEFPLVLFSAHCAHFEFKSLLIFFALLYIKRGMREDGQEARDIE